MIFTLGKVDSMMKTEHFKALAKNDNSSAIANHINWLAIVYCHLTDSSNLKRLFCYQSDISV